MRLFNRRNNNGTSADEPNALIQSGWLAWRPGAVNASNQSITFPKAYTNPPVVVVSFGGDTGTTSSTLGAGGANVNNAAAEAIAISTTGFTTRIASIGASAWAAGNTVYVQWIAIGV